MEQSEIQFLHSRPLLRYWYRGLHLLLRIMSRLWIPILEDGYGRFDRRPPGASRLNVTNLTGGLFPDLVAWLTPFSTGKSMLFAGEPAAIENDLRRVFSAQTVVTAGLEKSHVKWDFEQPAPFPAESFDIVYSQAMLEHLVRPFDHLLALISLVKPGGYLAVHSASFLFPYHRTPVHTANIMPDLIEIAAERSGMIVAKRRYHVGNLEYLLRKPER